MSKGVDEPLDLIRLSIDEKVYDVKCRGGRELRGENFTHIILHHSSTTQKILKSYTISKFYTIQ